MSLVVKCPDCDKTLKLKDELAGKKVRCPGCSTVVSVPAKSTDPDDDFEVFEEEESPPPRKRRPAKDDFDDDELDPPPRSRKPAKKKKAGRGKSSGTNWLLIGGLAGGGVVVLLFLAMLIASLNQARNAVANRANWPTFKHPLGFAQIDMPGTPVFNPQQSVNGSQTYMLAQRNYQMSLTAISLPPEVITGLQTNPAIVDLMFNEMETKTTQQAPGSKLLSSRRLSGGAHRGLELKIDIKGNINLMRFYLVPNSLVGAEFITRNETAYAADRERYFNSFCGPDGNPFDGPAQTPGAAHAGSPAAAHASGPAATDAANPATTDPAGFGEIDPIKQKP